MSKPNIKRLNKMADHVAKLNPRKFDMEHFGEDGPKCGFAGCAAGHAAHDRIFKGLSLVQAGHWGRVSSKPGNTSYEVHYASDGEIYEGFEALERLFGITDPAADYLFGADWSRHELTKNKPTPARVAARIREFAKTGAIPDSYNVV